LNGAVKTLMTDPVKEQLSACLDGELPEGELDLMLKQVGRDAQLRASLGRYALIGEALRVQHPAAAPTDFAKRVADAIAAEPAVDISGQPARRIQSTTTRWLRPAAGFAVAAGVAAMAMLIVQQPQQDDASATVASQGPSPATTVAENVPDAAASYIVPASTSSSGIVPAARLTNYVVAHSEYSSPLGRRSVLTGVLAEEDAEAADTDPDPAVNEPANEP
jgi:sigma-E factor negative regulatory protein RseA